MARAGAALPLPPPPLRTILQQPPGRRAPLERDVRLRREGGLERGGRGARSESATEKESAPAWAGGGGGGRPAPPRHAPL